MARRTVQTHEERNDEAAELNALPENDDSQLQYRPEAGRAHAGKRREELTLLATSAQIFERPDPPAGHYGSIITRRIYSAYVVPRKMTISHDLPAAEDFEVDFLAHRAGDAPLLVQLPATLDDRLQFLRVSARFLQALGYRLWQFVRNLAAVVFLLKIQ
jgi:hypothetical protein